MDGDKWNLLPSFLSDFIIENLFFFPFLYANSYGGYLPNGVLHVESAVLWALMTACNCSITHTNVHSLSLSKQNHCISIFFLAFFFFFFKAGLIVAVETSQPIEWGLSDPGNRENNVIFISGDISSLPHYHSTVNASFCPHNHERPHHLSVSPNWLFTHFCTERQIFERPQFVSPCGSAAQMKCPHFSCPHISYVLTTRLTVTACAAALPWPWQNNRIEYGYIREYVDKTPCAQNSR